MQTLHPSVLELILSFLSYQDYLKLKLVSKNHDLMKSANVEVMTKHFAFN